MESAITKERITTNCPEVIERGSSDDSNGISCHLIVTNPYHQVQQSSLVCPTQNQNKLLCSNLPANKAPVSPHKVHSAANEDKPQPHILRSTPDTITPSTQKDMLTGIELARGCERVNKPNESLSFYLAGIEPTPSSNINPSNTSSPNQNKSTTPVKPPLCKLSLVTTPKSRSSKQIRARNIFQKPSPVSPLLNHSVPIMSSAVYSPQKKPLNKHLNVETILCYHCGNIISLQYASKLREGVSKQDVLDVGRTMFDLEKLAETGMANKCVFSLENTESKTHLFLERHEFASAMLKSPCKSFNHCKSPSRWDVVVSPPVNKKTDQAEEVSKGKPCVHLDHADNEELFAPTLCDVKLNTTSLVPPWSTLDILDVEEMLQLLDNTQNVLHEKDNDINSSSLHEQESEPSQAEKNDGIKNNNDQSPVSPSPVPKRQLRPRKPALSVRNKGK